MTDEQAHALGKRLVACRHFRPLRGILDMQGRTWDTSLLWRWNSDVDVPDLRDPATLGCVLALVRKAWGDECAGHAYDEFAGGWFFKSRVRDGDGGNVCVLGPFFSEAEVLVAALEAAP